ncbi:MAG: sec-independent protein translocase protein TatC [Solirubrobacteraceae bacterium]|jgi:sec-independent protein translocase protein TatC|nr:sec-independent protein translocase protein TatC [Solirubrobacteraceae bacterium]
MGTALRPIGHEDRLSLVDHLSELRKRLVVSIVTLVAAFSFCFWQNHAILDIVTKPVRDTQNLQNPSTSSKDPLEQAARFQQEQGQALRALAPALSSAAKTFGSLGSARNLTAGQRAGLATSSQELATASRQVAQAAQAIPRNTQRNLVTLGVTEPFTATITIAFYASLLLAMPMLLFQAYAFVLPAFSPGERRVALPLMLMVPVLFIAGAAFGYFVVLERAVQFLQNFNDDSFDILLQAKDYFKFAVLFVAGIGLLFQIPVGVLAITRLGILSPRQLAKNRGYVILGIAVVAAVATPTPDPFTMTLAMAPLVVLFELSILLARWIDRIKPVADDADGEYDPDDAYDGVHVADEEDLARADGDRVSVADVDPPKLQDPEPKD